MRGEVSLTCDAWQASNTDGYFAVTGHWIEEGTLGEWTEEHALLGFTQLNTAHNGTRLGQALYKVCNRLDIVQKVSVQVFSRLSTYLALGVQIGHITCNNAANNGTMLQEFARCYNIKTGTSFDVKCRQIRHVMSKNPGSILNLLYRCLAHIINLATQAVISTRSKSKYYSGDPEAETVPEDVGTGDRDEIGIVRAICVKVCLSFIHWPFFTYLWNRHALRRNESSSSRHFKSMPKYALASCCWT